MCNLKLKTACSFNSDTSEIQLALSFSFIIMTTHFNIITEIIWIELTVNVAQSLTLKGTKQNEEARKGKCKDEAGDECREERPKREIVTTELVAGAHFFHHLPCAAGRRRLKDWERVRVKPTHIKKHTIHLYVVFKIGVALTSHITPTSIPSS